MASRQQSYTSRQIGSPDELSEILARKFCNKEAASMLVVGLPRSGKRELADALEKKLKNAFKIVIFDSAGDCTATFRGLLGKLDAAGINIDSERIKRGFDLDPAPSNVTKITIYQDVLKNALDNFSSKNRGKKLLLVIQGAEKIGSFIEDSVFYKPPDNVVWTLISSSPIKVVVSEQGGSLYAADHFDNRHTFYLKPFHGLSIESFCKLRKIEEKQVWEDLMDFLSRLPAFARDDGQPSNFLEALRMKVVEKKSIPNWVEETLEKYGCFALFDNATGRDLLVSKRSGAELSERRVVEESAIEWLKKQTRLGRRFEIEYDSKGDKFCIFDLKITNHRRPHYTLKVSALDGRRINVVATLLRAYANSMRNDLEDAWCRPSAGADWREMLNDRTLGGYAHFNSVELETKTENGKNTSYRRVRREPNLDAWTMHGPA